MVEGILDKLNNRIFQKGPEFLVEVGVESIRSRSLEGLEI